MLCSLQQAQGDSCVVKRAPHLVPWQHGHMGLSKGLSLLNFDWFFNVLGDLLATDLCLCNMETANGTAGVGQGEATTRVGSVVWVSPCSHLGE